MAKPTYQVPFFRSGGIPHYAGNWRDERHGIEWRDVAPFKATLTLKGFDRGRSAANFQVVDEHDAEFTVFLVDMVEMIRDKRWRGGKITATFIPCKRGQNYGIRLAE